jgi:hypothetical protein
VAGAVTRALKNRALGRDPALCGLALALGYYFVKKAIRLYEIPKQTQEPERQGTQRKES